jgi:hypothetical protein
MSVTCRLTGKRLADVPLTDEALMRRIGQTAIVRIRRRTTDQNKDADGKPFAAYSPRYALAKELGGWRVFGHSGYGRVNLTLSGDMLNALAITRVTKNTVTLGWSR